MSAHWQIGMEVECIDDGGAAKFDPHPTIGRRYFISEIRRHVNGVALQFTTLRFEGCSGFVPGFWAGCFRPIQKRQTDISALRALLTPTPEQIADLTQHEIYEDARSLADGLWP